MDQNSRPPLPHLLEIIKIVEGAVNADPRRSAAYAEQLAGKLAAEGHSRAAETIRRTITKARALELTPARMEPRMRTSPVDGESRLPLGDEEHLSVGEVDVVLPASTRRKVDEFLAFVRAADRLIARGVGISPAMLLYGPPGCGKTQLARHIASQLELPLVTARTDALISSFLGNTAKNIRLLFDHAASRPCVLFLDEFDALAKLRDDRQELGELKRVVVSLLQNIDSVEGQTIFLAATNHDHLLDSAVWRRFAFKLRLDPPDLDSRRQLFLAFLGESVSKNMFTSLATAAEGLTGADIRQVSEASLRRAVLDGNEDPSLSDLLGRIAESRLQEHGAQKPLADQVKEVKALAPKVYTNRRLADIFDVSVGHISNLLHKGEPSNGI